MTITRRRFTTLAAAASAGVAAPAIWTSGRAQGQPIRIGCSVSLTGPLSGGVKAGQIGYELWRDDVNAAGGIRLELWDDGRGLPPGAARPSERSQAAGEGDYSGTGIRMIRSLARQLGAVPNWGAGDGGRGTQLSVTFRRPVPPRGGEA